MKSLKKGIKNNCMKFLKELTINKPIFIVILAIIFFIMSIFASLIGFNLYLNEKNLLKSDFLDNEVNFYLLFISVNGLFFFFFFLAKGLWQLQGWTRYFMLGSSFISLIYTVYNIIIYILMRKLKMNSEGLEFIFLNNIYIFIYLFILNYFNYYKIEEKFNK